MFSKTIFKNSYQIGFKLFTINCLPTMNKFQNNFYFQLIKSLTKHNFFYEMSKILGCDPWMEIGMERMGNHNPQRNKESKLIVVKMRFDLLQQSMFNFYSHSKKNSNILNN